MAIQVRRGNEADFDASKMLPGEWAVSLDTRYVRMCFAPGLVLRMAIYESFEADMAKIQSILAECKTIQSAVQRIQSEVNTKASLTIEYSKSAKEYSDSAHADAERAKTYANNAEAVTGVQIATMDRAGLVKGGDNYIAEDGALTLIKKTTAFTMQNSNAGRLKIDSIGGGESKQNSTAGNQLFDKNASGIKNGYYLSTSGTEVSSSVSSISDYIDVSKLETAYLNYAGSNTSAKVIGYYDANKTFITYGEYTSSKVLALSEYSYIRFTYVTADADLLMLNAGNTALPWEEYSGGIPSPNPSYPQEIKKTVVSEIRTHGKNLLDANPNNTATTQTINGVTFTVNSDGTVTANGTATANAQFTIFKTIPLISGRRFNVIQLGGTYTGDMYHVAFDANWAGGKDSKLNQSSEMNDTINYSRFRLTVRSGAVCNNLRVGFMVSTVDFDTYEPYTESAITLSQPVDLYGRGDVQDVIEDGKVKRKYENRVWNGSEKWNASTALVGRYYITDLHCKKAGYVKCTQAKDVYAETTDVNVCYLSDSRNGQFIINTSFATIGEWKAHLAEHPMTVVYELATETIEELPIADQIALNSLSTYDGITYLEFDSEIEPTFKCEYGTSKVGGYTLEGMLAGRNGELYGKDYNSRLSALETSVVNNI